jgi:hypothetical protein
MPGVERLLQAFLSPAIFVSASALLLLSLNARLMGIVARLRQFHREQQQAVREGRDQEAAALAQQIASVEERAERIRRAFLFTLLSLGGTILTCLLLGLGLYWPAAQLVAIALFVSGVLAMLIAVLFYVSEIAVALSSVREEARLLAHIRMPPQRRRDDRAEDEPAEA